MNPLINLQTGWVPPVAQLSSQPNMNWQQGLPQGLMGNVLQQPTQQAGLMSAGSLPSLQNVQPGDWSSVAYNMAGRPIQGPSPAVTPPPMPPGVTNGTQSSGGSGIGGTALGILGALAKNPSLLKSGASAISSLLGPTAAQTAAIGPAADAAATETASQLGAMPVTSILPAAEPAASGLMAGGSPTLSAVGTGAVGPAVDAAAADAAAALGGTAAGSGAIGAAGANALAASGGFATGGAAGAAGSSAGAGAGAGASAGLAGVAGVAALPALVYGLMSIYDKPGLLNNLAKNYAASGQVTQHNDPQLAAQYGAALGKAQAGGGMGSIAGGAAMANQNSGMYYTTSSGKRLDSGFSASEAANLYNAAYVDPKLASPSTVNAYLAYMQKHGG